GKSDDTHHQNYRSQYGNLGEGQGGQLAAVGDVGHVDGGIFHNGGYQHQAGHEAHHHRVPKGAGGGHQGLTHRIAGLGGGGHQGGGAHAGLVGEQAAGHAEAHGDHQTLTHQTAGQIGRAHV